MNALIRAIPYGPSAKLEGDGGQVVRVWRSGSAAGEIVVAEEDHGLVLEKLRALGYVAGE